MIDLTSGGIFAAMLGDDSLEIRHAIRDHTMSGHPEFCSYSPHRSNYWRNRYISMLKELTGFTAVSLFSTGAEATEAFWRCCRVFSGKPGIWGGLIDPDEVGDAHPKSDSMHGVTLGSLIMAGKMSWQELGYFPELGENRFGRADTVTGGMIMEPYHAPSAQFHRIDPTINRIASLQKEFPDIPLCLDEIQGGFGRTGKLWAHQHYPDGLLKPDFITIGKLCGGGLPLSALLGPKEIMESDSVKQFAHLHATHSGNPLMCAVGCTVIEEMQKQRLIERSAKLGREMHEKLKELPVRVHGKGLLAGIELTDNEEVKKVVGLSLKRGIQVCDTGRKWVKIGPALNIEEGKLMEGIKILMEVVGEVVHERKSTPYGPSCEEPENSDSHLLPAGIQGDRAGDDQSGETPGSEGKYN